MSVPASLSSREDAIRLADVYRHDDLVAIVDGPAKLVMPVGGPIPPGGVQRVDGVLLEAVADEPGSRLVIVTRRHTGPPIVLESELDIWRQLQQAHRGRALALCDWLVLLDDTTVLSLADLAGPPADWS